MDRAPYLGTLRNWWWIVRRPRLARARWRIYTGLGDVQRKWAYGAMKPDEAREIEAQMWDDAGEPKIAAIVRGEV